MEEADLYYAKYGVAPGERPSPFMKMESPHMLGSPGLQAHGHPHSKPVPPGGLPLKGEAKTFDIDLHEWIGHRVLARRDTYFCPGVVKNVYEGYSVSILFDGEEQPLIYHEVLAKGELDTIISDAVPTTSQVR